MQGPILFVGVGTIGSNALSLLKGFQKIGKETQLLDTKYFDSPPKISIRRVCRKVLPWAYEQFASAIIGLRIAYLSKKLEPSLVFVFKGNFVSAKTLGRITVTKVHYHPDDSTNPFNRSRTFHHSEVEYDLHFTSKRHNISEISERTGKECHFIWYAYDPDWHFRIKDWPNSKKSYDLGFIGHYRPDRSALILDLSKELGKRFAIAGSNWRRTIGLSSIATVLPPQYGVNFSRMCAEAPVQLGLLNSDNRDLHTARSFEVPATGALLIAENTSDHRELFKHMSSALLFETPQELRDLLRWIDSNPSQAQAIALKGYELITSTQNTWEDRAREILTQIELSQQLKGN